MPVIKAIDLPGKRIRVRIGWDRYAPNGVKNRCGSLKRNEERYVVAISSNFSFMLRRPYENRAVIAVVQSALADNGLHVVCKNVFEPSATMPEEEPGSLCTDKKYVLVDNDDRKAGELKLWKYPRSDGGSFYGKHDLVMDMILDKAMSPRISASLKQLAESRAIQFEDWGKRKTISWKQQTVELIAFVAMLSAVFSLFPKIAEELMFLTYLHSGEVLFRDYQYVAAIAAVLATLWLCIFIFAAEVEIFNFLERLVLSWWKSHKAKKATAVSGDEPERRTL